MEIIESLDTLWFSNNVLLSTTQNHVLLSTTQNHPKTTTSTSPNSEAPPAPIDPVPTTPQTQHGPTDDVTDERYSKVVDFDVQVGDKSDKEEEELMKVLGRMRKVKRGLDHKRKIVGGLDFGFDVNEVYAFWMMMDGGYDEDERNGSWPVVRLGKMPPLSDAMAMKVHIKSWAYAVACAVN